MRLIDADAIHINITGGRMNGKVEFANAIEEAIKDAPTIEAIPIEWLLDWEQKYNESLPPLFRGETVIKEVFRDWRAEWEVEEELVK